MRSMAPWATAVGHLAGSGATTIISRSALLGPTSFPSARRGSRSAEFRRRWASIREYVGHSPPSPAPRESLAHIVSKPGELGHRKRLIGFVICKFFRRKTRRGRVRPARHSTSARRFPIHHRAVGRPTIQFGGSRWHLGRDRSRGNRSSSAGSRSRARRLKPRGDRARASRCPPPGGVATLG